MEKPAAAKYFTFEDGFDMSVEELRQELEHLGQQMKGTSNVQLQKNLAKLLSPSKSLREEWKIQGLILYIYIYIGLRSLATLCDSVNDRRRPPTLSWLQTGIACLRFTFRRDLARVTNLINNKIITRW